ncbi:YktB family protein [Amphibacillus sediminis]|uniref:YktB family protein n=1 Tax=Amphibacillus sediminis TaxID=360185 RepID=UPI00082AD703|nr:DUF1054 domain-containing protein [Amphibacillus sediminis]
MTFTGFKQADFNTFQIDGLDERMSAIQERIQPKFQLLGRDLTDYLASQLGNEMFLHIAKHARRTVNPPKDTWLAIADNKRGYKKHPHFEVGLFDDRLFIWLSFIYELPNKDKIAQALLDKIDLIHNLPAHYVISLDHMQKDAFSVSDLTEENLKRFRDVKKAELLIGKHILENEAIQLTGEQLIEQIKTIYNQLIPLYQVAKAAH